jgi:hypothetical protein
LIAPAIFRSLVGEALAKSFQSKQKIIAKFRDVFTNAATSSQGPEEVDLEAQATPKIQEEGAAETLA